MRLVLQVILFASLLLSLNVVQADDANKKTPSEKKPFLTVCLIDLQGKPVVGAQTGMIALINGYDEENGANWSFGHFGLKSDSNGLIHFRDPDKYRGLVFARHAGRRLVAVKRTDLLKEKEDPLLLTMYPECHVTWQIKSKQLNQIGKKIGLIRGLSGSQNISCQWCNDMGSKLHFFLPPGEFTLVSSGEYISPVEKKIVIKEGQKEFNAGVTNADAKKWILLEGKPAPKITDVREWKNGPPVKISQFRGKVVILEFWGWWCSPCVLTGIPSIFQLQDEFSTEDLVIVGIHTPYSEKDEVTSVKELDKKLNQVQKNMWKGKTIDFPVALTQYRKLPYLAGGEPVANSKMCVDYGIDGFPSSIVIDRKGNVVGKFRLRVKADRDKLRQLIKEKK
ncbi:TlpA family protein disulfide reductase [Gimesia aquarii]|uniref:Thiol-disulfide oxidoreductase ResA n=1 Tax=Gimesia aquarii TaxID=2527964 RepID=A0A517WTA8_9PLAN|nr:TlpA disulfide reductase family protein [Gimesia aquarii]QDU08494.1 Thiol-disulfide oxidoreductase ResA [Gimesia aquarii]